MKPTLKDARWVTDPEKVRAIVLNTFTNARQRTSTAQAYLWLHVIRLFWHEHLSKKEIARQLGCTKSNVVRIVRDIRQSAALYLEGRLPEKKEPPREDQPPKSVVDCANASPAYWARILREHGLFNPDSKFGWTWKTPRYRYNWFRQENGFADFFASFEREHVFNSLSAHEPSTWGGENPWVLSDTELAIEAAWSRKHHRKIPDAAKQTELFLQAFAEMESEKFCFVPEHDEEKGWRPSPRKKIRIEPLTEKRITVRVSVIPGVAWRINHWKYGIGEILKVNGHVACCQFPSGRVNLSVQVIQRHSRINLRKSVASREAFIKCQQRDLSFLKADFSPETAGFFLGPSREGQPSPSTGVGTC